MVISVHMFKSEYIACYDESNKMWQCRTHVFMLDHGKVKVILVPRCTHGLVLDLLNIFFILQ